VVLSGANISLVANNIDMCNLQIPTNSTIYGNVFVTCGISLTSHLLVAGNYTQNASTYFNIITRQNNMNVTFLKVLGKLNIIQADIYKDILSPGMNGTIRVAGCPAGQMTAKFGTVHDPYITSGLVDILDIDNAKGHILLIPTTPKQPKQTYFYEDWGYITAVVLLTLLAFGTFGLAKYMRRTRELDERLLQDGDRDKRRDSDEEDEEEEELQGMNRRLSLQIE